MLLIGKKKKVSCTTHKYHFFRGLFGFLTLSIILHFSVMSLPVILEEIKKHIYGLKSSTVPLKSTRETGQEARNKATANSWDTSNIEARLGIRGRHNN